ncbi:MULTISPECIES: HNH endonuclease [unclassified Rhizobium]|uniref:HNH endonuclease n=1 Tax=unclassified Rhizobium TaxID=2613769 RepID=UPI001C82F21D|nr:MULTISPECIES: HNH endonuclease signature motif containing protein [unclassified Rhizobium]MBX5165699.1 HNH endonuclease [Rhizobium sp. NZLR4b]MBX5209124.1 HNH endonuclease [Rhizobium sp. NZLR11]
MIPPIKPFDTYKWRWLSVAPSEGLLEAPVFLGVLRALAKHENEAPSSEQVAKDLARVQADTKTDIDLGRTADRNLIRNSGQYWKGTGLLKPTRGIIQLTDLGKQVSSGKITQGEFAALMVQQTVLPNPQTYSDAEIARWKATGLEIRPLQLILEVINSIGQSAGIKDAFLTPNELIKVVIPLAGAKETIANMVTYVLRYRRVGPVVVTGWPDCTPAANDHRLAREFMLFLANFDILRRDHAIDGYDQRFHLDELFETNAVSVPATTSIFTGPINAQKALEEVQHSDLPSIIERQKATAQVVVRKGQAKFRATVLDAYGGKCLVTGEELSQVLEAAHIVPVTNGGADSSDNSFCLRVDIHRLYDGQHIRILSNGDLALTDRVLQSCNYKTLPKAIALPAFVNPANVRWRNDYL